ncbi:hypothetical protein CHCC15337_0545 [Bacillus paralicheniformis]|nr:hypothetical protein CHCC15337_0545 [Bacillus paralicheniformis]
MIPIFHVISFETALYEPFLKPLWDVWRFGVKLLVSLFLRSVLL